MRNKSAVIGTVVAVIIFVIAVALAWRLTSLQAFHDRTGEQWVAKAAWAAIVAAITYAFNAAAHTISATVRRQTWMATSVTTAAAGFVGSAFYLPMLILFVLGVALTAVALVRWKPVEKAQGLSYRRNM